MTPVKADVDPFALALRIEINDTMIMQYDY